MKKPRKPYPDFRLSAHPAGRCRKTIRGKLWCFGADADAALQKYLAECDDLQAGQTPRRTTSGNRYGLAEMVTEFLADADARREAGELSPLSYRDERGTGERMVEHRTVDPTQIRPQEFAAFHTALAARYAPSRFRKILTVCRMMFRRAAKQVRKQRATTQSAAERLAASTPSCYEGCLLKALTEDFAGRSLSGFVSLMDPPREILIALTA